MSRETFVAAVAGTDLPEEDLTPEAPVDPMAAPARAIGKEHLSSPGSDVTVVLQRSMFSGTGPEWKHGELVGADYAHGELSANVGREGRRPAWVTWGYDTVSSIVAEDDSDCDPEDYVTCDDRLLDGKRVHLMWEYAAQGAGVVVRHDGADRRVWVRVRYTGKAGSGTPVVPLDALAGLVTDPRWQQ